MAFVYNAPKDSERFASLSAVWKGNDWNTLSSTLEFSEMRFTSNDEFFFLYCLATKLTDFKNFDDIKMVWSPQLVTFKVAKKDYEQYSSAEKKKVPMQQSRTEKLVCKLLSQLDPAKCYEGVLYLMDSPTLDMILSGTDKKGNPMEPGMLASLLETCGSFEETIAEKILDSDVVCPAKSGGGGYGAKAQTELEKLNDRMSFIKAQMSIAFPGFEIKSAYDLTPVGIGEQFPHSDPGDRIAQLINVCFELMK